MSTLITTSCKVMYLVKVLFFFKTAATMQKCGLPQGFFMNLDGSSANV